MYRSGVELRQLRYVLAVAEHLHFGRAAAELGIAQPPLSQQIKTLERELGTRLFDRTSRRVALTAAGEAFCAEARRALSYAERAERAASRVGSGESGRLALGFVDSAGYHALPSLVRAFQQRYPDVELVFKECSTAEQTERLHRGELDAGILRPPLAEHDRHLFRAVPLGREPFVAVLPARHPLAGIDPLPLARLADEPFILFPRHLGPGLHDEIHRLCRRAGFEPQVAHHAERMHTILGLVAGGLGVTVGTVPPSAAALARRDITYCAVSPSVSRVHLALVYRAEDPNPVIGNLVGLATRLDAFGPHS